jgi:hypothetical protein
MANNGQCGRATVMYALAHITAMVTGMAITADGLGSAARLAMLIILAVVYGVLTPPLAAWGRQEPKP